jgi:hypothetical protein
MKGTWQTTDSGGSGGGGGGLVLVVIVAAALLIGSGAASAIARALEVALIVGAVVAGLAVLGGIAVLVHRVRHVGAGRPIAAPMVVQAPRDQPAPLEGSHSRPAIGPGREVHIHLNVTPDQLAEIMRHYTEENP